MRIIFFGGTFDPPHLEHVKIAESAVNELNPDKLIIMPTGIPPHKIGFSQASPMARYEMCKRAFSHIPCACVRDDEIKSQGKSFSYITIEKLHREFGDCEILFLMGSDMMESFGSWRNPDKILEYSHPVLCSRGGEEKSGKEIIEQFSKKFSIKPYLLKYQGEELSSTMFKIYYMLGLNVENMVSLPIISTIEEMGLYAPDKYFTYVKNNLTYKRLLHTAGVVITALKFSNSLSIPKQKIITSAVLHDCAKYADKSIYSDFTLPEGVPEQVVHQYFGAYIAERVLGVDDEDILNAIRYHTSGRPNMSQLEKLIYTADMIEPFRNYDEVEKLRKSFAYDFEKGFVEALKKSYEFVLSSGKPIYKLTADALEYYNKE